MDARVARSRAAVLRTATDLLVEGGPSAVTIDAIAARSGVAKTTIYRQFESREDVLVAVIEQCAPNMVAPDPELGFEHAVRDFVAQATVALTDPEWARVIPSLLLLKTHQSGIADLEERLGNRQDETFSRIVELGISEGFLEPGVDVESVAAVLIGPLVFAQLTGRPAITDEFASSVANSFLDARRPRLSAR